MSRHNAFLLAAAVAFTLVVTVVIGCADGAPADGFADQFAGVNAATQRSVDFESSEVGKTPDGFTAELTGGGGPVSWVVQATAGAPSGKKVLAQTSSDS